MRTQSQAAASTHTPDDRTLRGQEGLTADQHADIGRQVDPILRPRQVATLLGISLTTLWRLRRRLALPEPLQIAGLRWWARLDYRGMAHWQRRWPMRVDYRDIWVPDALVARPWFTGRMSAAVLVRKTDKEQPTLLFDESDAAFNGEKEYAEALRGILNSGYRRSGKASLCVGQGANITDKDFSTFGAKAITGIGVLPDTIADRAIPIKLKRRAKGEYVERFRERDAKIQVEPIGTALEAWATDAIYTLRAVRPSLPAALNDRAQDVWEPLLAIADLVSGVCARAAQQEDRWTRARPLRRRPPRLR